MLIRNVAWPAKAMDYLLMLAIVSAFAGIEPVFARERTALINVFVPASTGGTFTDDELDPSITLTIPPGALNHNAKLIVRKTRYLPPAGANQTPASPAFRVKLKRVDADEDEIELAQPMTIALAADPAPVHPQLGEIAILKDEKWLRLRANFYRASEQTVVALTKRTKGKFRVIHRTLQARSGAAVERGRDLYFNETWTSESYWGGVFGLHEVLNNVDPFSAAGLGAQIDITKVPQPIVDVLLGDDFALKQAALADPATTQALIKAGAVLGLKGSFDDPGDPNRLTSVGLTCALCHVTVTETEFQIFEPPAAPTPLPVGLPIIGPPNAGIDVGRILSFTPLVQAGSESPNIDQYQSWGPGGFDPRFLPNNPIDDGFNNPSQIPQHWNFLDLAEQDYAITWIGILQLSPDNNSLASGPECGIDLPLGINGAWGTQNAVIKNFEFGNTLPQWVFDALDVAEQNEPGNAIDEIEYRNKLLDIKAFMESIVSPPPGPFDEAGAEEGMRLFFGKANCVACHSSAEGTGRKGKYFTNIVESPPQGLLGLGIKVPGLRGLTYTAPYFHDGSAATLADVVARYTSPDIAEVPSTLTAVEQASLVEYLKSL